MGRDFHSHPFIALFAGVQMVAGVIFRQEVVRFVGIPKGGIKVDEAVNQIGGADKFVVGMAHFLAEGGVGAPAAHGEQGAYIDLVAEASCLGDVALQTLDQLLHGGQVAHGAEDVDSFANRVDDVVDALLDDDGVGTGGGDFMMEPVVTGKTVGFVGQAVVFPEDPGTGGGTADDGGVVIALPEAAHGQFIGPVLAVIESP